MPPPSFSLPPLYFFLSRPILSSSRYSSFLFARFHGETHGKDTAATRVAYRYNYARASISDLDCVKDTRERRVEGRGQIMHAIDCGHFVISIPRSSTVLVTFAGRLIMRRYDLLLLFSTSNLLFFSSLSLSLLFLTFQTFLFRVFIAPCLSAERFLACLGDLGGDRRSFVRSVVRAFSSLEIEPRVNESSSYVVTSREHAQL